MKGDTPSERTEHRILYDQSATVCRRAHVRLPGIGWRPRGPPRAARSASPLERLPHDRQVRAHLRHLPRRELETRFELNPDGVKGDHQNGDASYDPVWGEGASQIDAQGGRRNSGSPSRSFASRATHDAELWTEIWRTTDRLNEQDMWAFWRLNEPGGPTYFGTLAGIVVGARPRRDSRSSRTSRQ